MPSQDCDTALIRRFERRILVPFPGVEARRAFFEQALSRPEMDHSLGDDDVGSLADETGGYSCSDLGNVCKVAAMAPIKDLMAKITFGGDGSTGDSCCQHLGAAGGTLSWADPSSMHIRKICQQDFITALRSVRPTTLDQHEFSTMCNEAPGLQKTPIL